MTDRFTEEAESSLQKHILKRSVDKKIDINAIEALTMDVQK